MDNEPDIWNSTHDDVMPTQPNAEAFMQLYFAVAKKARAKFPNIKLTGPVPASEWQWYSWNNNKITVGANSYTWLEFFIKRCSEEQTSSGIRLLDVIDIHSYPGESNNADIVQGHRVYYDTTYSYPGANGVKTTSPSGWDNTITQEYVFGRVNKWLNQYMGPNHGVTCAVSEFGLTNNNANVTANSYSSILGTFADNGVEFFTPWYWYPGMWETLHLFSRYAKNIRVKSVSTNELDVSAYSSINSTNDSMTVILVNRALTATHATTVNLANFTVQNGTYSTKQISNLPSTETFVSHTNNALISGTVTATTNTFSISLPALSTTAIILKGQAQTSTNELSGLSDQISIFPNPSNGSFTIENSISDILGIEIFNLTGEKIYSLQEPAAHLWSVPIDLSSHASGIYFVQVKTNTGTAVKKLFLNKK